MEISNFKNKNSKNNEFPYEIKFFDKDINKKLLQSFTGEKTGFVQVFPYKWCLASPYIDHAKYLYNMEVRKSDTWIVTFPRSGTTLTQELIWQVANNFDFETGQKIDLYYRFPYLENMITIHDDLKTQLIKENQHFEENIKYIEDICIPGWKYVSEMQSPRFIKTHLPFSLLPKNLLTVGCKVIYVVRNPKDTVVSFYHLSKLLKNYGYQGPFDKYLEYFMKDMSFFTPYWQHVKEGWEQRNNPNLLFLFYEDIVKDMKEVIKKVAEFLNRKINENDIENLVKHLSFENFRKNNSVNLNRWEKAKFYNVEAEEFIRKGKVNGWNQEFNDELSDRFDKWMKDNLKEFSSDFKYHFI